VKTEKINKHNWKLATIKGKCIGKTNFIKNGHSKQTSQALFKKSKRLSCLRKNQRLEMSEILLLMGEPSIQVLTNHNAIGTNVPHFCGSMSPGF